MRRPFLIGLIALLAAAGPPTRARTPTTVLVELFTSEGCSSCPPADTLLERLIDTQPVGGAVIVGLGQHVDYWDRQGWRDRFSSAGLTDRQRVYSGVFHADSIYTPQMIVDGQFQLVGSDAGAARAAVERAAALPHADVRVAIDPRPGQVTVSVDVSGLPTLSPKGRADVMLAVTEDGLKSAVRAGENSGRQLQHAAVVRRLEVIGQAGADGARLRSDLRIDRAWAPEHVKVIAFVQERSNRHILGAGVAPLQGASR